MFGQKVNGNIQIGDSSYDLRPEETSVISRNLLTVEGPPGKRYVLNEHAKRQRDNVVENKANIPEKIEQDSIDLRRRLNDGRHKETVFPRSNPALSSDKVDDLHNISATGDNSYTERNNGYGVILTLIWIVRYYHIS
ncbi:hypothetical protein CHS0354_031951 [Potamilus streckersoni]|uniref:Uncharacterized protein n=1 Tax=Potamilus streckersoni TaxID=2493646 RepID=A0AAE0S3P7_9BIVA|nr:hypothetical protein CHS0354_031951 [Potamilus streckersoni]